MIDPLDFLEADELLRFLHCHKTELSSMENPHTFLNQLRDHNLVPENRYKKMSRMKSKQNLQKNLYDLLDWVEKERSQYIKVFWGSVFKDTIIHQYPTLRLLRNSLMDGSFHFSIKLPEKVEQEEKTQEEEEENIVKKRRKTRSMCDDNEQAGPSSSVTPVPKKKSKKIYFSPPQKDKNGDFCSWPIYKFQLPVTCGQQEGLLDRVRLTKGEKCIAVKRQWFTPPEFEKFAGKQCRKWKLSIRCNDIPLGKLIEEGHLESVTYKGGRKKTKKSLFPPEHAITVSEGEEDGEDEEEEQALPDSEEGSTDSPEEDGQAEGQTDHDSRRKVYEVKCGALAGTLHVKRFASGTCGKCIRTETTWMTPMEFAKVATGQTDPFWRKDIKWEEKPLSVLTEAEILRIHSLLCSCKLCKPDPDDIENQKNDDECYICKSGEEKLVVCDQCPCSFHQKCHLPHIDDAILGDNSLWMCTFCVFRSNRGYYRQDVLKREAVMSCQISQHMLECQYLLLRLSNADDEQIFALDPNIDLQDYSTVIETPMWFSSIAERLQKKRYQAVGEFESDVQLVFKNCASYNRDNAEFLALGNRLKKFFDEEFTNVFNIGEC